MAEGYERRGSRRQSSSAGRKPKLYQPTDPGDHENMILAALPPEEYSHLRPYLEFTTLKFGHVLWEPNDTIGSVYFPTSGVVSFVAVMRDGASLELGRTGREGFVGIPVVLGASSTPVRASVQIEGQGFKIRSGLLRRILPQTPQLELMLRRYAHAHVTLVAQKAACNYLHEIPERLARWLAMTCDRTESELLPLTQEFLAQMLGCRRSSVTAALSALQRAGVIRCGRGQIQILNRRELERRTCECYRAMRRISHPAQIN
jgi:CRP-like cAMP-binding protein